MIIQLIGGPLDGTELCAVRELRPLLMVFDYETDKPAEATPMCYERRGDVYVFAHRGTAAAEAGFGGADGEETS